MGLAGKTDQELAARVLSERVLVIKQTDSELQVRRERRSEFSFGKSARGLDVSKKKEPEVQVLQPIEERYSLNSNGRGPGAMWDGNQLKLERFLLVREDDPKSKLLGRELWKLSEGGKILVIKLEVQTPQGIRNFLFRYLRKSP